MKPNTVTPKLNARQNQFVTLYTSGRPAGRAYEEAGYASRGAAADTAASKLLRIPKVAAAVKEEQTRNREHSSVTHAGKLAILEGIMENTESPNRDRIRAIQVHNVMTGDNEPEEVKVSTDIPTLEEIKDIAKRCRTVSPLLLTKLVTAGSHTSCPR